MLVDSTNLIAETVHSPNHTVRFAEALGNGDITASQYAKLRGDAVNGTRDILFAVPFAKALVRFVTRASSNGKASVADRPSDPA